jgi:hypothetical protein
MPLLPPTMQGMIQLKASSTLMSGSKFPTLASALSSAICQYILMSAVVNSTNQAMGPGGGSQIGRIVGVNPSGMSAMMMLKATSKGIVGRDTRKLFDAVSYGVVNSLQMVVMQGTIIGAGPGSGTGKILNLIPTALEAFIFTQAAFRLLSGSKIKDIISAVAFGVCNHIMTVGTVTITDIGVAATPPAGPVMIPAAPGIGRLM